MKRIVRAVSLIVCLPLFVAVAAKGQAPPSDSGKLAYFHLTGTFPESPESPNPFDMLTKMDQPRSFKELLDRLKKAREDNAVKGVVLTFENLGMGLAQLQELREAVRQVRAADKDVYIHAEEMNTGLYALATCASHICMVPTGDLWLIGIYGEQPYLKGSLDKLAVEADFMHFEEYKAAAEIFYREGPSPEAEANMNWLLDGIHEAIVNMIADARQMPPDKVGALIDNGPYTAEDALKLGLIDSVKHRQDFVADLKQRYGGAEIVKNYGKDTGPEIPDDFFGAVTFFMNMLKGAVKESTAPSVGIVYVEGMILPGSGEPQNPLLGGGGAYSTPIRKALDKAAEDDTVKAVVLRVDSPGGSALASEIILDASKRVAAKKPLIVSMGNVAGSGGYYVACGANAIFADETTITASIGVVGGKLVTTGFWNKLGVNWHEYARGQNAAIMSSAHRFSDRERGKISDYMEGVYKTFKGHVVAARGDKLAKPIGEIAGGRVFTGKQALDLGLVDKLGGLGDAIKYAAAQAKVVDYEVRVIPRPKDPLEMLMTLFGGQEEEDEEITASPARSWLLAPDSPLTQGLLPVLQHLDPQRVQAVLRTFQCLELIDREGVIAVMPEVIIEY